MTKVKYTHNSNFFTDDSAITAYWCGFIAADGCIVKVKDKNSYRLQVRINKKDLEHLTDLVRDIDYTGNIIVHSDIRGLDRKWLKINNGIHVTP